LNPRRFLAPLLALLLIAAISESSADEAVRLSFAHPALGAAHAINWANAIVNQLVFVTTDPVALPVAGRGVVVPYVAEPSPSARSSKVA